MGGQKSNIAALESSLVNCAPSKENYAFFIKIIIIIIIRTKTCTHALDITTNYR